ncbi:hypothetical protein M1563_02540 [Patescibacteria group bacterium]|nr:hypothetical protein [Patescibacteria group bacterium]MCL5409966.1 hypothetical protein [Patescibacteria group bacterium]
MGKNTKNFRQTARSRSGNQGAQNYAKITRMPWHQKILNFVKVRGKKEY